MFLVSIKLLPLYEMSLYPKSSATIRITLGLSVLLNDRSGYNAALESGKTNEL